MKTYKSYYINIATDLIFIIIGIATFWFGTSCPTSLGHGEHIVLIVVGLLFVFKYTKGLIFSLRNDIRYYEVVQEPATAVQLVEYKNLTFVVVKDYAYILSKQSINKHKDRLKNNLPINVIKYFKKDKTFLYKTYQV